MTIGRQEELLLYILTGEIGIGKTLLCRRLALKAEQNGLTCGGIISVRDSCGGRKVVDIAGNTSAPLARRSRLWISRLGSRYTFFQSGFDFGNRVLNQYRDAYLLIIDELGRMEKKGQGFFSALSILNNRAQQPTLVVVRKNLLHFYSERLSCNYKRYELTRLNRSYLANDILSDMRQE